jgi:hypothetical protein
MSFYIITGLPRSRTAWLATYFTYGESFCFHDELLDGPHVLNSKMRLASKRFAHVGHADPVNILYWQQIDEMLEHPKWVIVWRNPDEVITSCQRFMPNSEQVIHGMIGLISKLIQSGAQTLSVDFRNIDATLPEIEKYLGLTDFCPPARKEMLCRFNVQIEADRIISELKMKGITLWESA